jgi:lipopolysaccharide heptosyltransferase II
MKPSPKKILIVLHGSVGDVTRAIPLANLVRKGFPQAFIAWAVEPASAPLVERHPAIDEIILFERAEWRRSLRPFLTRVRSRQFDLVLDLQRHLKSGLISWWSGAPVRIGFHRRDAKELNWIFNNRHIPAADSGSSKLGDYLKFAELLGIEPYPIEWNFPLLAEEAERVESIVGDIGAPFAVFYVGARWESKRWFADETAKAAAEIQRLYGLQIVLLGGEDDAPFAKEVQRHGATRVFDWTGRTTLREAIGILSRAKVAVGPDSGLMHLSAAVGTPVVSLWGPTDPGRTGPFRYERFVIQGRAACAPCYLRRCPIGRVCMRSITSESVVDKVGGALGWKGGEREAPL